MTPEATHLPNQPTWRCRQCDQDWPCPESQNALKLEFHDDRLALIFYLSAQFTAATADLGEKSTAEDLWQRFMGWADLPRPPSLTTPTATDEPPGPKGYVTMTRSFDDYLSQYGACAPPPQTPSAPAPGSAGHTGEHRNLTGLEGATAAGFLRAPSLAKRDRPARHNPARPSWQCDTDDEPWPCAEVRRVLPSHYSPAQLREIMTGQLIRAAIDLQEEHGSKNMPTPGALHARFLAWIDNLD